MLVLGLENSGALCSCALAQDDTVLAESTIGRPEHSRFLPGLIDTVLASAETRLEDVDLYAISVGPGSFTSLRVGLSIFKAMAFSRRKSLVSVPTLFALAREVDYSDGLVCPIIDAKRGDVYYALYCFRGTELEELDGPDAISLQTLVEKIDRVTVFLGSGVAPGRDVLRQLGDKAVCLGILSPRVSTICRLGRTKFEKGGGEDIFALEPIYMRPSYADPAGKLSIEPMKLEQLDEVDSIETESFRYPWSKNAFAWEINSQTALSRVAMIDKKVAGYLVLWTAYDEMHLGNIAVAKRWRRRGVAEKMMRWLLREAKRRNVARLTLEVRTCNYPAIALYKKFGFREVAVRKQYYPEGTDAYLMSLELSEQ